MRCQSPFTSLQDPLHAIRQDFDRRVKSQAGRQAIPVTIRESKNGIEVVMDVPGVLETDLDITVHDGQLVVTGNRKESNREASTVIYSNRSFGEIHRILKLDDSIDPDSVDAVLDNGVLTVTMNRRPELQPRKVTVRPAGSATV